MSSYRTFGAIVLLAWSLAACQPDRPSARQSTTGQPQVQLPVGAKQLAVPKASVLAMRPGNPRTRLRIERLAGALPSPSKNQGVVSWFPRALTDQGKRLEIVVVTCQAQHPVQLVETRRFVLLRILGPAENDSGFCGGLLSEVQLRKPLGDRPLYTSPRAPLRPPQLRPVGRA